MIMTISFFFSPLLRFFLLAVSSSTLQAEAEQMEGEDRTNDHMHTPSLSSRGGRKEKRQRRRKEKKSEGKSSSMFFCFLVI